MKSKTSETVSTVFVVWIMSMIAGFGGAAFILGRVLKDGEPAEVFIAGAIMTIVFFMPCALCEILNKLNI